MDDASRAALGGKPGAGGSATQSAQRSSCVHTFRVLSANISTLGPAGRGVSAERWGRSMEHGEIGRWWALRIRLECTIGEAERRCGAG